MAYFFTLLFIFTAYVTPAVLFGSLSEFHIEVIVVILAILSSIPNIPGSGLRRAPQNIAFAGMATAIFISIAASGWISGGLGPVYGFMQPVLAFYLVAVNCRSRRRLQGIILALVLGSVFYMVQGIHDLNNNVVPSLFLFGDDSLRRLRGLGWVNDPNDFSQVMVALIPAIFLWRRKSVVANVFLLGIPIATLLYAMYLTHSRGAMLALMAVILVAARRKIGTIPASIVAGVLFALTTAIGWSGGRDVSMEGGADRLDLWSGGIELIKAHPLFGVGLSKFADYFGNTAHNSVIVCAAEIGLVGLFFWSLFMLSTMRSAIALSSSAAADPDLPATSETTPPNRMAFLQPERKPLEPSLAATATEPTLASRHMPWQRAAFTTPADPKAAMEEIRGMARILTVSLTGFLTAGWFLSRALSFWLFMLCGMVYAVSQMAADIGQPMPRDSMGFLLRWSAVIAFGLLFCVYVMLRLRSI